MTSEELDFVHIMERLQHKAEADGKVSKDEEKFLRTLKKDVNAYQKAVKKAKVDEVISEDEFHNIVVSRDKILNKAMDFETKSDEINALVQELFDEINKHELPGMYDDEGTGKSHDDD